MDVKIIQEQFNRTMDVWIDQITQYDYSELCVQPNAESWSIGQVYQHLISDTKYYFQQVYECQSNKENEFETMSDKAKEWFQNNSFPVEKLAGPPDNDAPTNPISIDQLLDDLGKLKVEMNEIGWEISKNLSTGKTKHPGFHFFNSAEWFQFAEMHFRHHFLQKERIDAFLKLQRKEAFGQ